MTTIKSRQLAVAATLPVIQGRNQSEESRDGQLHFPSEGFPWLDVPKPFFAVVEGVSAREVEAGFPSTDTTKQLIDIAPTLHCVAADAPHRYTLCQALLRGSPSITLGGPRAYVGPSRYWADTIIEGAHWTDEDLAHLTNVVVKVPTTNGILPVETPWSAGTFDDRGGAVTIPALDDLNINLPQYDEIPVEFIAQGVKTSALVRFAVEARVRRSAERFEARIGLAFDAKPRAGCFFDLSHARRLLTLLHGFLRFCTGHHVNPIDFSVVLESRRQRPRPVLGPFWQYQGPSSERMDEPFHFPAYPPVIDWWQAKRLQDLLERWFALSIKHHDLASTFRSLLFLPDPLSRKDAADVFRERILFLETMRPRNTTPIAADEIFDSHVDGARASVRNDSRLDDDVKSKLLDNLARANRTGTSLGHHLHELIRKYPQPLGIVPAKFSQHASKLRHTLAHESGLSARRIEQAQALNPYVLLCAYVRVLEAMSFGVDEVQDLIGNPETKPYWLQAQLYRESLEDDRED